MPRLRASAGRLSREAWSKKGRSPQVMRPQSGCWKPAIDIRVVVLPHPLGPSRVSSSPSLTVKDTSVSAASSPKALPIASTVISGIASPRDACGEQAAADDDGDDRDRYLDHGHGRDWPVDALLLGVDHGHA